MDGDVRHTNIVCLEGEDVRNICKVVATMLNEKYLIPVEHAVLLVPDVLKKTTLYAEGRLRPEGRSPLDR